MFISCIHFLSGQCNRYEEEDAPTVAWFSSINNRGNFVFCGFKASTKYR